MLRNSRQLQYTTEHHPQHTPTTNTTNIATLNANIGAYEAYANSAIGTHTTDRLFAKLGCSYVQRLK